MFVISLERPKVHHRVPKIPLLDPILHHLSSVHSHPVL